MELIEELKLIGKPVAWLILRPRKNGTVEQEVVLSPLTDEHIVDDGDEAWPLYLSPNAMMNHELKLIPVEPQPDYIEMSGRWCWPLPEHARFTGCCTEVVTASREWWEYAPSEAKPHPMAEAVRLRDNVWYWAVPNDAGT